MSADAIPMGAAVAVVGLILCGAALSLLGTVGLVRLRTFYQRVHAPTLGATMGMALVLVGSALYFAVTEDRRLPREILVGAFLVVTTPVTLTLLARAALFRKNAEEKTDKD